MATDVGRSAADAASGCQPTASAAGASSRSGIPCATIHYLHPYDSIEEQARIAAVEADTRRDIRIVWLQRIVIAATWIVVTGYALKLAVIG